MALTLGPFSLDRAVRAVELVRQRLLKATAALEAASIPYAVAGGNAIALWVSRVDVTAVRNTSDVDLLVRRADFDQIVQVLTEVGFHHRHAAGLEMFLDTPESRARDGIHLVFAEEIVRVGEVVANPPVTDSEEADEFRVLKLEALVQMKLTSHRDKDRTHLRDLIEVGLIDAGWVSKLPEPLAERLQAILDTPEG